MKHGFRVYGEVHGQGRPKVDFNRRRVYKAKKDVAYERKVKEAYINSGGQHFGKAPIAIMVVSHRVLPASKPKKMERELDTYKPDASNILKAIEDALNNLAYDDDSQIIAAFPIKAPRERIGSDYVDVFITDEINDTILNFDLRSLL